MENYLKKINNNNNDNVCLRLPVRYGADELLIFILQQRILTCAQNAV